MRDEWYLLGRILFSLVFVGSGVGHLMQPGPSAEYAAYKKVPNPKNMVLLSGVLLLAGGLAIMFGALMDLAAVGIALLCIIMAVMMHPFWKENEPQTKQVEQAQFMKNIALAGGALVIAATTSDLSPYTLLDGVF
jgi:uncharacterized membrane protein YphA (DoxX/SURF4 family)